MGYVFISYSSKNKSTANAMRNLLKDCGIETWMAPDDIPVGSQYAQVINRAIKNCSCFLLMLTEDAQKSIWVAKEVERAINYRIPIIPVQKENVVLNDEFELYISSNQIINIKKIDKDSEEVKELLSTIRRHVGVPETEDGNGTETAAPAKRIRTKKDKALRTISIIIAAVLTLIIAVIVYFVVDNVISIKNANKLYTGEEFVSCEEYTRYVSGYSEGYEYAKLILNPYDYIDFASFYNGYTVSNGKKVTVETEDYEGWTLVRDSSGDKGYVKTDWLYKTKKECFEGGSVIKVEETAPEHSDYYVIEKDGIELRKGPSTEYEAVDTIDYGSMVQYNGTSEETSKWYYVFYYDTKSCGWVPKSAVSETKPD